MFLGHKTSSNLVAAQRNSSWQHSHSPGGSKQEQRPSVSILSAQKADSPVSIRKWNRNFSNDGGSVFLYREHTQPCRFFSLAQTNKGIHPYPG